MESCTCILCANPHYLYKSFKRNLKKHNGTILPDSLTTYLTSSFKCSKDHDINYFDVSCIIGTCENNCTITLTPVADEKKMYTYVRFKSITTKYFNSTGKQVEYKRCARTELKATLKGMQDMLIDEGAKYQQHRFIVSADKASWSRLRAECPHPNLKTKCSHITQDVNIHCIVLFSTTHLNWGITNSFIIYQMTLFMMLSCHFQ